MTQTLIEFEPRTAPKDALATAANGLEDALAAVVAGRERDWAAMVVRALRQVERGLRCYRTVTQTAGPFAEFDQIRPTVLRHWTILYLHYRDLLQRVQRLRQDVQRAAEPFQPVGAALAAAVLAVKCVSVAREVPVFEAIRQQAQDILIDLNKSREAETALLMECVATDIGVGDCRA